MNRPRPEKNAARRDAVLVGWRGGGREARSLLGHAAPEVRASALAALVRIGDVRPADLAAGLADPASLVRRRALTLAVPWVGADTGNGPLSLLASLDDPEDVVVEVACFAVGECDPAEPGAVARLAAIATGHDDSLCREAAVAALGSLGDEAGLPAILAACHDKATVRRRAVLALAPFDGPEVDAAMAALAQDRDWQVRQAAEDLLSIE